MVYKINQMEGEESKKEFFCCSEKDETIHSLYPQLHQRLKLSKV